MNFYQTHSNYGISDTKTFTQVFPTVEEFIAFYEDNGIPAALRNPTSIRTIYYLLCARYANSAMATSDENRFRYNVASLIFQHGPIWEKQLEIQTQLRDIDLTSDDWLNNGKSVFNISQNPATDPAADEFQTLDTINQQNMSLQRKGRLEGLAILSSLINTDFTEDFILKFKHLFRRVLVQRPLLYEDILDRENIN